MLNPELLEGKFARIGARLQVAGLPTRGRRTLRDGLVSVDVRSDRDGEYFELVQRSNGEDGVEVLDVQPADRHLLLLIREGKEKHKLLCGHDERHWFVAAVPESAPIGTVRAAKEALKPREVREREASLGLRSNARNRRKNAAYHRQGEWFFVPARSKRVPFHLIVRNEPITRGNGSKPHWVDECYRIGGESVFVCSQHPNGVRQTEYERILRKNSEASGWYWRSMRRNPEVYVRGRVRHADHRTITLRGWHRVLMNTEGESQAMRHVAFLD
jgi:hypothetical protein